MRENATESRRLVEQVDRLDDVVEEKPNPANLVGFDDARDLWRNVNFRFALAVSDVDDNSTFAIALIVGIVGVFAAVVLIFFLDSFILVVGENYVTFTVELFGARPNWVLRRGDEILGSWRERPAESVLAKKPSGKIFTDRFANVADAQWFECMYQHYKTLRHEYCLKALKAEALKAANEEYHQRIDAVKDLEEAMKKAQGAEKYRRWGELLKAELSHLKSALKSKTLKLGDETITVDESLTPAENMLKFFTRAKKLERTKKETGPRLEKAQAQLQKANVALSVVKELVDSSLSFDELIEKFSHHKPVTAERVQAPTQKKKTKESKSTLRRFLSKEGRTIMLGRNHKENDELVMRIARGNDLWFHVKGRPGAHVIVQLPSKAGASLETMLDAATLVAHYSGVASGEKVEVDYTLRKNVKRRPGGGASRSEQFLVNYTGAKTLVILVDEERLSRLLGGS